MSGPIDFDPVAYVVCSNPACTEQGIAKPVYVPLDMAAA